MFLCPDIANSMKLVTLVATALFLSCWTLELNVIKKGLVVEIGSILNLQISLNRLVLLHSLPGGLH